MVKFFMRMFGGGNAVYGVGSFLKPQNYSCYPDSCALEVVQPHKSVRGMCGLTLPSGWRKLACCDRSILERLGLGLLEYGCIPN